MNDDGSHQRTMVVELPAASGGRLVGVNGVLKDREWPIQRTPFTFGRMPASHVNLDHETGSSRNHAELNSEGPYYTIVDKSANGTKINGLPIPKGVVHPLRHNDIITICNTTFRFEHELMSEEAPEPTGVFNADSFKQSNSDDGVVVALDAMDALARVARVEAEAVQIKSQAEAELVRVRAEAESSHQESRRFRRNVEEAADAKSSEAEAELVRLRAEAEAAQQESRRFRRLAEEAAEAKAAAAEAELAHLRAEIEEARAQAEARARVEAEARALIEARAAAEHAELEQLRSESRRFSIVKEQPAISGSPSVPNQRPGVIAPLSASGAPSGAPSGVPSGVPSNAPSGVPSSAPSLAPSSQTRNMSGSLLTTTADSAYQFSLGDNLMLILSADNLRGETLCTAARLIGISQEGVLTIDCVEPVSAARWNQKTVMVGKNPHNGSLLVAETKILFIDDNDYNTVRLSNPGGRLMTVQLRSSVRQRAIPEVQTFTRHDGLVCRLIDYSIGGLALVVPRSDTSERGDAIAGTLQLKRSLVFDVTIEVRGVTPLSDSPDEIMLNCRFSTREMDSETLRKIAMAVLYRR
jgi:pSer/pThr/pTyr-binding forkhead associated (FHA) protein